MKVSVNSFRFGSLSGTLLSVMRNLAQGIAMLTFVLWLLLFVLCWPLALLALVLYPIFWLFSLPFRLLHGLVSLPLAIARKIAA